MKSHLIIINNYYPGRSREGVWIEIPIILAILLISYGRSREGAWIEIPQETDEVAEYVVAPVEGAWIEIANMIHQEQIRRGRSREGAWIEIQGKLLDTGNGVDVAPARERGLK